LKKQFVFTIGRGIRCRKMKTDRKYRIAHIDTERTWRGGQQQVYSLVKGLEKKGHSTVTISWKEGELSKRLRQDQHRVFEVKPWSEIDIKTAKRIHDFLLKEKIDIVHAHAAHAVSMAALSTLWTNIPFILTRRVDFHFSRNLFSRWKYSRAKKIIAISNGVYEVLRSDGIPRQKLELIPSGIDFERHMNLTSLSRDEMGIPKESIVIGQVAALAPHKDQRTFLKAISILRKEDPSIVAVMVGEGELREDLEALAVDLGIKQQVIFLGFQKVALECLRNFDLFCMSSKEEGLGTSLLDAMALEIPVVATRVGGIPDLIKDGETGFLAEPQNPEKLASKIKEALMAGDKLIKIKENALHKARTFNVSKTVDRTENLYHALLN